MPGSSKPPNLPPSKRVLYRVPNTAWVRPEFVRELLWRRHVYNNAVQSMREVFRREVREETSGNEEYDEVRRMEGDEFEQILARNAERNKALAGRRLAGRMIEEALRY
jgi:Mitochondrial ribosome subunit S26